jgi:hypothetical protein
MTPGSRNSSLLGSGSVNTYIPAGANVHNNITAIFSVVSAALFARQRCGKHISAAVNQHATIEKAVFSVGSSRGYIMRISGNREIKLSRDPVLAVAAEN